MQPTIAKVKDGVVDPKYRAETRLFEGQCRLIINKTSLKRALFRFAELCLSEFHPCSSAELSNAFKHVPVVSVVDAICPPETPVDEKIDSFIAAISMRQEQINSSSRVVDQLLSLVKSKYPGCKAHWFGSAFAGFGLKGSDLDVWLEYGTC